MHPAAGADLVDIPDRIPDPVMIEIDPVLQMGSMVVAGMVDRLEIITSQKDRKLAGINLVIFIAFAGDQFVVPRFRDDELLDLLVEVPIEPAGHRALFHRKDLLALERTEDRADGRYGRRHGISRHDSTSLLDSQFGIVCVYVCSNVIRCHGVSFHITVNTTYRILS